MPEILQFPDRPQPPVIRVDVSIFATVPMWSLRRTMLTRVHTAGCVALFATCLRKSARSLLDDAFVMGTGEAMAYGLSHAQVRDRSIELLELAAELEERQEQASNGPAA